MAVPETPITRLEQYWAAILDKIQGGGSAPVLETLEVSANGTYTPDEGVDGFDEVTVNVPNPNYVETISGTLGNPWGSVDTNELATEIATFGANAMLNWDATAIGFGANSAPVFLSDGGSILLVRSALIASESDYQAVSIEWRVTDGVIQLANALTDTGGFVELVQYASLITTTLTIIHHPLPDGE